MALLKGGTEKEPAAVPDPADSLKDDDGELAFPAPLTGVVRQ